MLLHDSPTKTIGVQHHHSVSRCVRRARKNMTAKQLSVVITDDCFGALTDFWTRTAWSELVRKHSDPMDDYRLPLYEHVVIGRIDCGTGHCVNQFVFAVDAGERAPRHCGWMEFSAL
jgi:hypothetical protein